MPSAVVRQQYTWLDAQAAWGPRLHCRGRRCHAGLQVATSLGTSMSCQVRCSSPCVTLLTCSVNRWWKDCTHLPCHALPCSLAAIVASQGAAPAQPALQRHRAVQALPQGGSAAGWAAACTGAAHASCTHAGQGQPAGMQGGVVGVSPSKDTELAGAGQTAKAHRRCNIPCSQRHHAPKQPHQHGGSLDECSTGTFVTFDSAPALYVARLGIPCS